MNPLAWFWFGAFVVAAFLLACALVGGFQIREQQRRRIEQLEAAGHPLQLVKGGRP